MLKSSDVKISFIRGTDKRRNRARSWFWQRRRRRREQESKSEVEKGSEVSIEQHVKENGNGGDVEYVGGRISLAHEDAKGYAAALRRLLYVSE